MAQNATILRTTPPFFLLASLAESCSPLLSGPHLRKGKGVGKFKPPPGILKLMWQFPVQEFKIFSAHFACRLFVPPLLNLCRRFCLPLLFKLHALHLVN